MAGNHYPWRDIYSVADWQSIRDSTTTMAAPVAAPPAVGSTPKIGTNRAPNPVGAKLASISSKIIDYHAVPKDFQANFGNRINLLNQIEAEAVAYINLLGASAQVQAPVVNGAAQSKQLDATNPTRIDRWVASLAKRARKKADYLTTMSQWVLTAESKHKNYNEVIDRLIKVNDNNVRGTDGEFLAMTPYAKMEKYDPYHRSIVFMIEDDGGGGLRLNDYNHPMGIAFAEWSQFCQSPPTPGLNPHATFYEWLERHPICTGTPGVTTGYDPAYKSKVRQIQYNPTDLKAITVRANQGIFIDLATGGGVQRLDTAAHVPGSQKGPNGSAAFAWDANQALFVHAHVGRQFHHSSFTAGTKIRCSGMITVKGGYVSYVSNESGHYGPQTRQLYYFVDFLVQKKVIYISAQSDDHASPGGLQNVIAFHKANKAIFG